MLQAHTEIGSEVGPEKLVMSISALTLAVRSRTSVVGLS